MQRVSQDSSKIKQKFKPRIPQWGSNIKQQENDKIKIHVYNFFITEGHYDLANTFAKQAQINVPEVAEQEVERRLLIKNLIKSNNFDEAIKQIQAYNKPLIQDETLEQLIFTIKCLKIINLIKQNKISQAIESGPQLLLRYVKSKPERIKLVERVMSLIAYVNYKQSPNHQLLHNNYKNKIADEVNSYLLHDKSKQSLKILLNLGKWLEKRLQVYAQFPHLNPWAQDLFSTVIK